jgi:cytochrome c
MAREIEAAGNEVVCGDCHLANGAIEQETGSRPVHPIQLLARAYGIPQESS